MDNDKPFKTIEVIDSRTNQVCKVACMSCIRGHRTTSCGNPVCRTKVFWTVKRPGRPSNSCTCRYGATGGCKCVVARSACPHKAKKGEKRSGECRCDEQGRYCTLLESNHWDALLSLQKPTVDFFSTREALESKQAAEHNVSLPQTPAYSSVTSPPSSNSIPNTPAPQARLQPVHIMPNTYNNGFPTMPSSTLTPRFGMMGIGAPMGSSHDIPPDVLVWEGQAPPAPRDYNALYEPAQPEQGSCCQSSTPSAVQSPAPRMEHSFSQSQTLRGMSIPQPYSETPTTISMSQLSPAPDYMHKLQMDYFQHQFPNAICQNCGLSGCTCRNCPPIFQNFGTTSWAQCCGRKHARDVQPTPPVPQKIPRTENYEPAQGPFAPPSHPPPSHGFSQQAPFQVNGNHYEEFQDMEMPPPGTVPPDFNAFDLDHNFDTELVLPEGTDGLDLTEFLMSDLDRSNPEVSNMGGREEEGEGGGGGGCCCSGR